MKVHFLRSVDVHDGKAGQAWEWAFKLVSYTREAFPETKFEVLQPVGGKMNRIVWFGSFDSLAAYEAYIEKLEADEGYIKRTVEAMEQGLFVATTFKDELYRVMG